MKRRQRRYEECPPEIITAVADLIAMGAVEPISSSNSNEARLWQDHKLALYVENRLGVVLDLHSLTDEDRAIWKHRAVGEYDRVVPPDFDIATSLWILDKGERAGLFALSNIPRSAFHGEYINVDLLHVFPNRRKGGVATKTMRLASTALRQQGFLGLRVGTEWSWQHAVRFYLSLGMTVSGWKHGITFIEDALPLWRFYQTGEHEARFEVFVDGSPHTLYTVRVLGERLSLEEGRAPQKKALKNACYKALETLSVCLAVRGWSLIRSSALWEERWRWSDCGQPEGLARKIEIFEANDRQAGYLVRTPRIPGILYRDAKEIDADEEVLWRRMSRERVSLINDTK